MSKQLFGTDGIRGQAGQYPLDKSTALRFGFALTRLLQEQTSTPKILLARDTRESGPWLRDAVAAGIQSAGGEAVDLGILPTPGLAFLCLDRKATAGVMISASHNPYRDNGLKVFASNGMKLSDELEAQLEALILDSDFEVEESTQTALQDPSNPLDCYLDHLKAAVQTDHKLNGLKIVLDAGNGAAAHCAPELYRSFGIEVEKKVLP